MKLENEFTVPAPVERAWAVLLDVERVAPCLPGAVIEGSGGDGHTGTMTIRIGPITSRYRGTVTIEEADERAGRAVLRAQARDSRGQGTAAATITSTLEAVPEGTRVRVETDLRVTGPAARFGRGVMQDVSAKLMGRFADCLAQEIAAAPPPSAPRLRAEGDRRPAATPPPGPAGDSAAAAAALTARRSDEAAGAVAERQSEEGAAAVAERRTEAVLDLGAASREAVLRRAVPAAAALAAALLLLRLLRRRR